MSENPVIYNGGNNGALTSYSPTDVMKQVTDIQALMTIAMKDGEHYGKIPGCGDKPSLLKAGAEKLTFMFRLAPSYEIQEKELPGGHVEYRVLTKLHHINTGLLVGEGVGLCSTMESKYRYRNANKICPECGKETIMKGKAEYGGGWLCYQKKGGCGAKFKDNDPQITEQKSGKIENENPADHKNTVLKMGKKRSLVDAVLTCTAASDIFTQDVEELVENGVIIPIPVERPVSETKLQSEPAKPEPVKPKPESKSKAKARNYTAEVEACKTTEELYALYNSLSKAEQADLKNLFTYRKEQIKAEAQSPKREIEDAKVVEEKTPFETMLAMLTAVSPVQSLKYIDDKLNEISEKKEFDRCYVQFKARLKELGLKYEIQTIPF